MARTNITSSIATLLVLASLLSAAMLFFVPLRTYAAISMSASLGGGNSLLRAGTGVSNANSASSILSRLSFAGTRGGQQETTPPNENSNTGGNTSTDQSNGPAGSNGAPAGTAGGNPTGNSASANVANNGGVTAGDGGNGGNGGSAAPGGLVAAGGAVSNANAINAINVSIVRISLR